MRRSRINLIIILLFFGSIYRLRLRVATSLVDRIIDLALAKLKTDLVEPIALEDEILLFNKVKVKL